MESSRGLSRPDADDSGVIAAPIEPAAGLSEPLARFGGSTGVRNVEERVEQALDALGRGEVEDAHDGLCALLNALRAEPRS
jgi:hypothetical protein